MLSCIRIFVLSGYRLKYLVWTMPNYGQCLDVSDSQGLSKDTSYFCLIYSFKRCVSGLPKCCLRLDLYIYSWLMTAC